MPEPQSPKVVTLGPPEPQSLLRDPKKKYKKSFTSIKNERRLCL